MDEWHAATALACLDELDAVLQGRRKRAEAMRAALEPHGFAFQPGSETGTWQFVPALAPTPAWRRAATAAAAADEIEFRAYFDPPLHGMDAFTGFPRVGSLEVTEALSERVISLPMANDLSAASVEGVIECALAPERPPARSVT